jgi:uroporphyrinogen III methyltransferase/synthase
MMPAGKVYLVGAGPGDPELLTLKGARCLGQADVVVYDYLANPALLRHARPEAELIYAGKQGDGEHTPQEWISRLLVRRAREGEVVVRLKGGDPFVFGRGGEEACELAKAGIPFEVVPGVTAAVAVPAYAGIPVTHRDCASSVAIVAGSPRADREDGGVAWDKLATGADTLVVLMGVRRLRLIAERLIAHGRPADTPAALIRWGTTSEQQTIVGTVGDIADRAEAAGLRPPATFVVGEVVRLREMLNWFEVEAGQEAEYADCLALG